MKKKLRILIAVLITLALFVPALNAILYYTKPMEDISYNLSLLIEDGGEWEGEKGWSVYTNEQGSVNALTPDYTGGYTGLDYPGQTIYYSRDLKEQLDSPTLQIGAVNRSISIFLDDTLIYTDCPDADNRIGFLVLPMQDYDRLDPVIVSLPPDYQGQTLTIAQSTSEISETLSMSTDTVWPCEVTLYCGYSYESGLIASASDTMVPAVLCFSIMLLLLALFVFQAASNRLYPALFVAALAVGSWMCSFLTQADFFYQYTGTLSLDPVWLFFQLSVGLLLLFFALYANTTGCKIALFTMTGMQWLVFLVAFLTYMDKVISYGDTYLLLTRLPQMIGFFTLMGILVCSLIQWKQRLPFWRHMTHAALVIISIYVVVLLVGFLFYPDYSNQVWTVMRNEFRNMLPNYTLRLLYSLCLLSGIFGVFMELIEQEAGRRSEYAVLAARNELALESYQNLQQHADEIMMLQHDVSKHYHLLRTMAKENPEKLPEYLDELVEAASDQRPVILSQNETLNLILNGKVHTAESKGISVELLRTDAPKHLPLKDSELCSLITNILDNAVTAAAKVSDRTPVMKLDFHCKEHHFVFTCENSKSEDQTIPSTSQQAPATEHGYGLKIIHRIMEPFGDMVSINETDDTYCITVVIPLTEPV